MTRPGAGHCLCSKPLDLQAAWLRHGEGADSQCVHCRRCYDSWGKLISAVRPLASLQVPHQNQQPPRTPAYTACA